MPRGVVSVVTAMLPVMDRPVHAQTTSVVTGGQRQIVKRAADLCRARPAVFAAVVRRADWLRAAGVERDQALSQALEDLT